MDTRGGSKRVNDVVGRERKRGLKCNTATEDGKWCDEMTEGEKEERREGGGREEKKGLGCLLCWGSRRIAAVRAAGRLAATMCCSRNN